MLLRAVKLDPSHHLPAPLAALRVCGNQAVRRFADHHTPPPHLPVAARTLVAPRLDLRQDELVDDAMRNLPEGLYEILIDVALEARLTAMEIQADSIADFGPLRDADAPDRIALFLSREVERALDTLPEKKRADVGLAVLDALIKRLSRRPELPNADPLRPAHPGRVLHAVQPRKLDGTTRTMTRPLIPLLDTALLTNAPGEPGVGSQVKAEIASADRIDIVMAFIRMSGIRPDPEFFLRTELLVLECIVAGSLPEVDLLSIPDVRVTTCDGGPIPVTHPSFRHIRHLPNA